MKQRKNLPYLPLFIDDWMQSSGLCDCSDATRGIYTDLLCVLFKERVRGTYPLHVREMTWKNSRSKTRTALGKPTAEGRLPYFIDFLVKPLRSKPKAILKALRELLYNEVITVRGDTLIQPRMFRDYGGMLPDVDGVDDDPQFRLDALLEADDTTENNGAKKGTKKGAKNSTKNAPKKDTKNSTFLRASAHIPFENGSENNNIDNSSSKGNIGGVGEISRKDEASGTASVTVGSAAGNNGENNPDNGGGVQESGFKREKTAGSTITPPRVEKRADSPANGSDGHNNDGRGDGSDGGANGQGDGEDEVHPTFTDFWDAYDKKVDRTASENLWAKLAQRDREAIMAYIPKYKLSQPTKRFRKNPTTFLRHRSWEDELIQENETSPSQITGQRPQSRRPDDSPKQVSDDNFTGQETW